MVVLSCCQPCLFGLRFKPVMTGATVAVCWCLHNLHHGRIQRLLCMGGYLAGSYSAWCFPCPLDTGLPRHDRPGTGFLALIRMTLRVWERRWMCRFHVHLGQMSYISMRWSITCPSCLLESRAACIAFSIACVANSLTDPHIVHIAWWW